MDQVKVALAVLKKQHFWILCVLIIIPSVVVWKMAVGHVSSQFDARKGEIEGHLSKVQGIKSDAEHPNQKTIDDLKVQAGKLNNEVFKVWQELYDNQQDLNPWPKDLGVSFIRMITVLPEDREIPERYREEYQTFINLHLPSLDEIIDLRRVKEPEIDENAGETNTAVAMAMAMGGIYGAGRSGPVEFEGITEWADTNRNNVRGRFTWGTRPSTAEVRVAQEDLWIYEAMLRVINETNAGATGNFNAAVKRIEYLDIGQAAGGLSQSGAMYGSGMGGMDGMYGMGGMEDGSMMEEDTEMDDEMEGGMMGGMGPGGPSSRGGRYVGQDGKPLGASAAHPYAEFKMMPVKIGVIVDQGKISDLLVNCANCTMPIDVRRVNLWSTSKGSMSLNVGRGSGMGMGMDMDGDMDMDEGMGMMDDMYGMGGMGGEMGMGSSMRNLGGGRSATGTQRELLTLVSQKEIPVEIEGIIYIFNKPVREEMGTGTEAETTPPASVDTEVSTTAAEPTPSDPTPETTTPETTTPETTTPETTTPGTTATPEPTPPQPPAGAEPVNP